MIVFNGKTYSVKALVNESKLAHQEVIKHSLLEKSLRWSNNPPIVFKHALKNHVLLGGWEDDIVEGNVLVLSKHQLKRCEIAEIEDRRRIAEECVRHPQSNYNTDRWFTGQRV
jgi:hypothetical protein